MTADHMDQEAPDRQFRYSAVEVARALGLEHDPTPEQAAVIEAPLEPLVVVAGAGSGKTETMAARVVWLVANGLVTPEEVLGLTFTRKAASELSARVERRLATLTEVGLWTPTGADGAAPDPFSARPTIATYHSYAASIVRDFGIRVGVEPTVRMLTEAASWQLAHEAALRFDGDVTDFTLGEASLTHAALTISGELAEHLASLDDVEDYLRECSRVVEELPLAPQAKGLPPELKEAVRTMRARCVAVDVARRYETVKRSRDALDFADQMALAARLASDYPDIGEVERQRFRVVLLDEFQDTSHAQLELLRRLFTGCAVTAVGDPHQSIYGWRGASATTLAAFQRAFSGGGRRVPVLPLATSWRNADRILTVANGVADPLRARLAVPVARLSPRPAAPSGQVFAARYPTDRDEAAAVATWLADRRAGVGNPSAAVLCRKRRQFRPIMEALEAKGVPFEVVGLGGLLLTPEVEDVVALLSVVQDPTRGDHLMRLLLGPLVRLGAADLDGLWAFARSRHRQVRPADVQADQARDSADVATLTEVLEDLPDTEWRGPRGEHVSALALERLSALAAIVRRVRGQSSLPLPDLVLEAEHALGLDIEVAARPGYYLSAARAHLDAFVDVAADFAGSADRVSLGAFLSWLEAAEEHERGLEMRAADSANGPVSIMTIHAAKGLEWDLVAVPGLVEATFPTHGSTQSSGTSGRWTIGAQTGKGWLGSVTTAGIPHALRGDRAALPDLDWRNLTDTAHGKKAWQIYAQEMGDHAMDEERRLAYVAFTRAKSQLLLTSSVWGPQQTPRVTSRFLVDALTAGGLLATEPAAREHQIDAADLTVGVVGPVTILTWAPMPPVEDPDKPQTITDRAIEWPTVADADEVATRSRIERAASAVATADAATWPAPRDEITALVDTILAQEDHDARPPTHRVDLTSISASNIVAAARSPELFADRLRRPMPTQPNRSARRGTRFHAFVEQHYAQAAILDWDELPGSADDAAADPDHAQLAVMKAHFLASEWADRIPIAVETAIETVLPTASGPVSVRGRIDAVFTREDGGVTIVDWKSGGPGDVDDLRARAIQLGVYAVAWQRIHDLEPDSVDVAFYFASTGETIRPARATLGEIVAVLNRVGEADGGVARA